MGDQTKQEQRPDTLAPAERRWDEPRDHGQPSCEVGSPDFIHERRMFRSFQHDHGQRGDAAEQPARERAVGER